MSCRKSARSCGDHYRRSGRMDKLREVEARVDRYGTHSPPRAGNALEFTVADVLIPARIDRGRVAEIADDQAADLQLARAELARRRSKFSR